MRTKAEQLQILKEATDKYQGTREEWRMAEQDFVEIPFSRLKMPDGKNGYGFLSNIQDERNYEEIDNDDVVIQLLGFINPANHSVQNIILKIASKPGCLTEFRLNALKLWFKGISKRDIAKILYPDRAKELDSSNKKTIGIEVYMQRVLNHYIPIALRNYAEKSYPYLMNKIFKYYPLHPIFVKKAFVEACRSGKPVFEEFSKYFHGNPSAFFMLSKIFKDSKKDTEKYEDQTIIKPEKITDIIISSLKPCIGRHGLEPITEYIDEESIYFLSIYLKVKNKL